MKVTRFLFLATIFSVTFEKVHWNLGADLGLADVLTILFLIAFVATARGPIPRTTAIVLGFFVAFLLVYLLGYFAIDTADASGQFGKGIFKWAIHILFLIAGVTYLGRRSERFYWRTIGVFTAGLVLNSAYGVLQLVARSGIGQVLDAHLRQGFDAQAWRRNRITVAEARRRLPMQPAERTGERRGRSVARVERDIHLADGRRDRRDDRDRYRDEYRDREWRDRRSPAPRASGGGGSARYSPKRRSYSRSPARGASGTTGGGGQAISPRPSGYDASANTHEPGAPRW